MNEMKDRTLYLKNIMLIELKRDIGLHFLDKIYNN